MSELEWVEVMAAKLRDCLRVKNMRVETCQRLAYGNEITAYGEKRSYKELSYETDLLIAEDLIGGGWIPRVVIEAKFRKVHTHDAITYSHKARAHRSVHPYLRYGIMLGNRGVHPLPGRLFNHGTEFDFMASFSGKKPAADEMAAFVKVIRSEIKASQLMQRILSDSRKKGRDRYTILHRQLLVS